MNEVNITATENELKIVLSGRIDSNNAKEAETEIMKGVEGKNSFPTVIDAEGLEYISSAGLRVLLHLKKTNPDLRVVNVNSDVYEILEMTGFTQMMDVEKAYRVVSVEGCEEIGRGANGTIYRIDQDNVVKVYNNADALADIQHEREVARIALVLGIPTAISYDVVKVGESYGSVFELLNAQSFSKILSTHPEKMDWCVEEYTKMLKKIHSTLVPEGQLPDIRLTAIDWAKFVQKYLPEEYGNKLLSLVEAVPHDDHMIHGDYHTKNLELQDDEVLLIDMDTLAVGHPIFELASIFNSFIGYSEYDHETVKKFQGFDYKTSNEFFNRFLAKYLGTKDENKIKEVADKARIVGYTRMIRRSIRRKGLETEDGRAEIEMWKNELIELLKTTDTLLFLKNELEIEAENDNLPEVISFIEKHLESIGCPPKILMQISVAAEEIFVNVANYAYAPEVGKVTVRVEVFDDPISVAITFMDNGKPFDPTKRADPNVTLSAEERNIGGLGIFMTKKMMDDVTYEYLDGKNILTLKKGIK
ncbi:MAG: anti-sigma factor antagonist [Clostridia bacterium]|nr:anti-sigma factor antagonist [Clostridia bacterium]